MADWLSQTELSVVGALLLDDSSVGEVAEKLKAESFSIEGARGIYDAILRLHFSGKPINVVSVLHELGDDFEPTVRQAVEWASFAESDVPFYASVIADHSRLGRIRAGAAELAAAQTLDAANAAMDALNGLLVTKSDLRIVDANAAASDFCSRMTQTPEYLKWGFRELDEHIYAETGDLILLGGYPSAGKTLLAVQLALTLSARYRVGFFSLETSSRKLADRIMTHLSRVPLPKIKRRELNEADWAAIAGAAEKLNGLSFSIVEASGMSVHDIQAVSLKERFDVIFVDYLQLINEAGRDRYEQVTNISQRLHTFSQSSGIAVVALSQLSRPDKQTGKPKPPTMASFRESGQIEQDADVALILYPSDPDDNRSTRILKVAKNKEGEKAKLELDFDGATQTMTVHEQSKGEKYRETQREIRAAGKAFRDQIALKELRDDPDAPYF